MDSKALFIEKLRQGEVFIFAGSGISYLSSMPSAGKVLYKTAEAFLPQDEEYKSAREKIIVDENNYQIQPEVFYESLLYLFKSTDTLLLWKSLSPAYLKSQKYPVVPNINHLFVVDYSVKNNVPIFTTNFDCLFEEAARELGYNFKVLLPHTDDEKEAIKSFADRNAKKNVVYIFKLHGSISINNDESLDSLCTTMTSISRANFPVIDLIETICKHRHIVFIGYSGRDIDYFPEVKKRALTRRPFWLDKFNDPATTSNCAYIGAVKVEFFPDEIFKLERPEFNRGTLSVSADFINRMLEQLQAEIRERVKPTVEEKHLLLGQLVRNVGEYSLAYKVLLSLYRNNTLSINKQVSLLLSLSSLAHENSRYESCGSFAREALKICKQDPTLESYQVSALCQISESKRMLIAHDTSFSHNINYLHALGTIASFVRNGWLIKRKLRKIKSTGTRVTADVFAIHDYLEHRIRLIALLQAFIKPIIDNFKLPFKGFLRNQLIRVWQEIRQECFLQGYSHGIANTYKFETRINRHIEELEEGKHIYDLTVYETGKGLVLRNIAEDLFARGEYVDSKKYFHMFFESGLASGNKLNAIKGLLGIAKCNKALVISPLLEPPESAVLKDLMRAVEGRNWQRHFDRVLQEIGS